MSFYGTYTKCEGDMKKFQIALMVAGVSCGVCDHSVGSLNQEFDSDKSIESHSIYKAVSKSINQIEETHFNGLKPNQGCFNNGCA